MATAQQIATRALRRIRVVGSEDTVAAADMTSAVEALDAMIASWEAEGLSGDVLPLSGRFESGIVAMLAVRLADEYGKEPSPMLVKDATDGWSAIQAAHFVVPQSKFDQALSATGHYQASQFIYGQDQGSYSVWQPNTYYQLRQFVTYLGNEYECTTAGTSALAGPTSTDSEVIDGSAVWCWRRVTEVVTSGGENGASGPDDLWEDAQW